MSLNVNRSSVKWVTQNIRQIGMVIFLIAFVTFLNHPLSVNDIYTQLSLVGIIIGFVLLAGR
ncbi:MAG: hypothetical protein GQ477_01145 [Nanohaloarchaea archaeon]|nr:hypothetical protein [Candidatus Nanohaloarchaea archaeon]